MEERVESVEGDPVPATRRVRRALGVLRACVRSLVHAQDEAALTDAVCNVCAGSGGYRLAWYGEAGAERGASPLLRAWAGPAADGGGATIGWEAGRDGGPVGRAMATGAAQVARGLNGAAAAPRWYAEARARGCSALIALPLARRYGDAGVLVLGSGEADAFDSGEAELLGELADGLAFGLETLALRRERNQLLAVVEATPDFIGTLTPEGRLLSCNAAAVRLLGRRACGGGHMLVDYQPAWARGLVLHEGIPAAIREGFWQEETALLGEAGEIPVSQIIVCHQAPRQAAVYLSTIMRDLRPHRSREQQLRASEATYRRIMRTAREGLRLLNEQLGQVATPPALDKLPLFQAETVRMVDVVDICYLRADGRHTHVCTVDGEHLTSQPLAEIEQRLDDETFVRTHRSYLVNLERVEAVEKHDGHYLLSIRGLPGQQVPVSRRSVARVREVLGIRS